MARKTHWNVQLPQCSEGLFFTLASQASLFFLEFSGSENSLADLMDVNKC